MDATRLWRTSIAATLALLAASSHGGATKDLLRTHLEESVTWEGRLGWKGFGAGSFVEFRASSEGGTVVDRRETLVRVESGGLALRSETRREGEEWTAGAVRPLRIEPAAGAERRVESLGSEPVEVGGKTFACTKERWTRTTKGVVGTPSLVVWASVAGVPVKWEADLGDGWKTTYVVVREDAEATVGSRVLRCREVRKTSVSTMPGLKATFESTELWSDEVPDRVVRQETRATAPSGPLGGPQTNTLTAFEAK